MRVTRVLGSFPRRRSARHVRPCRRRRRRSRGRRGRDRAGAASCGPGRSGSRRRGAEMPGSRAWSRAWRSSKTGATFACRIPTRPSGGEPRASFSTAWSCAMRAMASSPARPCRSACPGGGHGRPSPCGRGALWTGGPVDGEPCGRGALWHHRSGTRGERTCGAHAAPGGPSRGDVTGGALRPVLLDRPPGPIDRCAPVSGPSRMSPGRERCPNPAWQRAGYPRGDARKEGAPPARARGRAPRATQHDGRARSDAGRRWGTAPFAMGLAPMATTWLTARPGRTPGAAPSPPCRCRGPPSSPGYRPLPGGRSRGDLPNGRQGSCAGRCGHRTARRARVSRHLG